MNNRLHVAVLYICTGKYSIFWEEFYRSMEKYFLKQPEVEYFVFTDADKLYDEERNVKIHRIRQENLGWPGNTLFRFHMFVSIKEKLEDYDYLFFLNANTVCRQEIRNFCRWNRTCWWYSIQDIITAAYGGCLMSAGRSPVPVFHAAAERIMYMAP